MKRTQYGRSTGRKWIAPLAPNDRDAWETLSKVAQVTAGGQPDHSQYLHRDRDLSVISGVGNAGEGPLYHLSLARQDFNRHVPMRATDEECRFVLEQFGLGDAEVPAKGVARHFMRFVGPMQ